MKKTGALFTAIAFLVGIAASTSTTSAIIISPDATITIGISSPADGATVVADVPLQVSGTATLVDDSEGGEPTINAIEVTVDESSLPVVASLPAGPGDVDFSADISEGLPVGDHEICASASGFVFGEVSISSNTDCVTVTAAESGAVVVDCDDAEGDCEATAQDGDRSTLVFTAPPEFDEVVTIIPNAGEPGECGGFDCRTGYDVLFPTSEPGGPVGSIVVTTVDPVRFREFLRAAVFIDGEQIRPECSVGWVGRLRTLFGVEEPIPCKSIRYVEGRRLQYLVKFNVDPLFRFR